MQKTARRFRRWTVLAMFALMVTVSSAETRITLRGGDGVPTDLVLGRDYAPFPASGTGEVRGAVIYSTDLFGCDEGIDRYSRYIDAVFPTPPGMKRVGLVRRGQCSFQDKIDYLRTLHLDAVLIYNQGDTADRVGLLEQGYLTDSHGIPIFFLSVSAGLQVRGFGGVGSIDVVYTADMTCPAFGTDEHPASRHMQRHEVPGAMSSNVSASLLGMLHTLPPEEAFYEAALHGSDALVQALHRSVPQAVHGKYGDRNETPLHAAARMGHHGTVRRLAMMGANLDELDNRGLTALAVAIISDIPSGTRALLEVGADVNATDRSKLDALFYACRVHAALCEIILQHGASPNRVYPGLGESAFHAAVRTSKLGAARAMLRWGADPLVKTAAGKTAYSLATSSVNASLFPEVPPAGVTLAEAYRASRANLSDDDLTIDPIDGVSAVVLFVMLLWMHYCRDLPHMWYATAALIVTQILLDPGMPYQTAFLFIAIIYPALTERLLAKALAILTAFFITVNWWENL